MTKTISALRRPRTGRVMLAVVQYLVRHRVAYAWEICRDLDLKEGSVYPALETLRAWRRVALLADPSSPAVTKDGRALRRRYYTLTDEGWDFAELELRRRDMWTDDDDRHRDRTRRLGDLRTVVGTEP